MLSNEIFTVLIFGTTIFMLLAGYPVGFTLSGVALIFTAAGVVLGLFEFSFLLAIPQRLFGTMNSELLIAVPIFIFMGVMLERSKVAEELLETMGRLFGKAPGGLCYSVTAVGMLLAASTGIVGATVVTMGLLALPVMLKWGYDKRLATGTICAAGTLGQIIPPSIVLILLGDVLSSAYQEAQYRQGKFATDTVSVGDLFAGALVPGLMLVLLYLLYQFLIANLKPSYAPPVDQKREGESGIPISKSELMRALVMPLILIICVLGSILFGVATPTEASSLGAIGASLLAAQRINRDQKRRGISVYLAASVVVLLLLLNVFFDLRIQRDEIPFVDLMAIGLATCAVIILFWQITLCLIMLYQLGIVTPVIRSTLGTTSMVFLILIGASIFALTLRGFGGDQIVHEALEGLPGGAMPKLMVVMGIMFLLGFILDYIEITYVIVPIVAPILLELGVDPVLLGILIALNLQTSFLTPPFGFSLFYLRGVAPRSVDTGDLYQGIVPYILIQLIVIGLVALYPALATWLPNLVY